MKEESSLHFIESWEEKGCQLNKPPAPNSAGRLETPEFLKLTHTAGR